MTVYLESICFLCADGFFGFFGTTGVLLPLFWTLYFGMEDYGLVVYREVGSIPWSGAIARDFSI
jgi:hypothetical protein